jgi:GAF domain-containing protein
VTIDDEVDPTVHQYVRGMERLVQAVQELSLARDLEQVQQIVRTTARELVGSDGATFVLRDDEQCYYADEDAIEPLWKGSRFPMSACISGWTMLNKQPAVIEDIYADDRIPHEAYRPTFVKSLAMVPIRSLDPIGAIGNYWADGHLATPEEIKLLQALAVQRCTPSSSSGSPIAPRLSNRRTRQSTPCRSPIPSPDC